MARPRTLFRCQACGRTEPRWLGRCAGCGAWSSFEQVASEPTTPCKAAVAARPVRVTEVAPCPQGRVATGVGELDRVLGGGLVPGSLVLLGGDPGIGKSTLLLVAAARVAAQGPVLYATAEESAQQVQLRARRLGITAPDLFLAPETSVEAILGATQDLRPRLLIVDSIQTVRTALSETSAGSAAQVRESAARFLSFAKERGVPTVLVGHVTKDGLLAGPKVLEHVVDVVLSFEGERGHPYRMLRAQKNRFGSTQELGVFEMTAQGLSEVASPSALFLAERPLEAPGSCVVACVEGSRPLLVEIQAILAGSPCGTPRRTATGFDNARAALLLAVLEKRAGLSVANLDAFVNVAGGMRIEERAADLGVVVAAATSHLNRAVDRKTVVFGEVGLAGEVRAVGQVDLRLCEASRLGFRRCVLPASVAGKARESPLDLCAVRSISEALEALGIF
jgi:DNA repair protein RadA/Sms